MLNGAIAYRSRQCARRTLLLSVAGLALTAGAARAQSATTPAPAAPAIQQIVVTGSRITSAGYRAPTPTQVLGAAQIAKNAEPNIFTTIAELPSLQGSTGTTTGTFSTSSGTQGLSSFSLRGLGAIRTLTLLDGQRVVGANVTGVPDISEFPQLLVQRVDVVTGGASASYGSDAVGGVVNFITDKHFEGFKANVEGGITTYGDDGQELFQAAAGKAFMDDKLHVEVSAEYDHEDGVPAAGFGPGGVDGRTWFQAATLINRGVTNDGSPQYIYSQNVQAYQYSKYGLITNGPLQGTAFTATGQPFPFAYGSGGVPGQNAAGTVSGCYAGFCVGGDQSADVGIGASLESALSRVDGYSRIAYDLDANNEVYATINIAQVASSNQPNPGETKTGVTLQCSNPYVPGSIQQACATDGITSFQIGTVNPFLPNIEVFPTRSQYRFVGGADGSFDVFGKSWRYDAYYEHGENFTDIEVHNIGLNARYSNAVQAITLNGQIVCASATARASGCVPIDIIGGGALTTSQLDYIMPPNGPFQHTRQTQDAASVSFSGEPISLWAGPVSVAFGGEYRREAYRVNADPYGNGVTSPAGYSAAYPADPSLSTAGGNWYAGNYHDGHGAYNVGEAFGEFNLPFLDTPVLGQANLNVAGRWTNYSTSGNVHTWKVGATWVTPLDWIRLRIVGSRDVRAPNLSELFAAPISTHLPNFNDPFNGTSVSVSQNAVGNPNLKPEIAHNLEAGVVLTSPPLLGLKGFNFSVDYYQIDIDNAISTLAAQDQVNYCHAGVTQLCGSFYLNDPTGNTNYVNVEPFNLASIFTDGFDIEASDQWSHPFGLSGHLTIRALATKVDNYITNTGLPGAVSIQMAGTNTGNTPYWKLLGVQTWETDRYSFTVQERWISDGVFGHQYVVCSAGNCPVSTNNNPTINDNFMPGAFYLDLSASYNISRRLTAYAKVDNVANAPPAAAPQTNTGLDANPALYDLLGRMYHVGLRYNF